MSRHADWWPLLLVVVMLTSLWTSVFKWDEADRQRVVREAIVNHANIAHGVANHVGLLIDRLRIYHQSLTGRAAGETAQEMVRSAIAIDKSVMRLMHFDAAGRLLFSTGRRPEAWLLEAAKVFAHKAREGSAVEIEIGTVPSQEYTHAWSVPIFVQHPVAGKKMDGFILALVDLGEFSRRFEPVKIGKSGEISIAAIDGRELLRLHEGRLDPVGSIEDTGRFRQAFQEDAGAVLEKSRNGHVRIYAYRRIHSAPLITLVSRYQDEVLMDNQPSRRAYYGSAILLTLLLIFLVVLWMLSAQRRRSLIRTLTRAQVNNEQLIKQIENEKEVAYRLATYDKLTGLPNRMLFAELSGRHARRAQRMRNRFAVLFIDLDRFKPVNDTHGHKVGDQLLVEVARRLLECMRQTDVVSRYGGDEFVALVADLHNSRDVAVLAEKIIERLSQPFVGLVDTELRISPSIGIALYPDDAEVIDTLVRQADAAMYLAKQKGRATYAFVDAALNRRIALARMIEEVLPAALGNRELGVLYQPRVSLADFRISALDASLHWDHPQMGSLCEEDFVSVAEKSGTLTAVGEYLIDAVCRQLGVWSRDWVPLVPVAVRISMQQLRSPKLVEFIARTLERHGVDAGFLELEITGSGLLVPGEGVADMLHGLDRLGVRLIVGECGKGLSGFANLRGLPACALKIEARAIRDLRNDSNDAALVSNIVSLCQSMKLLSVAEGVETREQLAYLRTARCNQVSGQLFMSPCPAAEIEPLLINRIFPVDR